MPEAVTAGPTTDSARPEPIGKDERTSSDGQPGVEAAPEAEPVASGEVLAPEAEKQSAIVPLPGTLQRESRPSFWKRISMRKPGASDTQLARVLARLDAIESRVTETDLSLSGRMQQLDERFTEVWEVEEQLSQMTELGSTLEELSARLLRLDGQLRGIDRKLTLLSVLVAAAVVAGVLAMLQ